VTCVRENLVVIGPMAPMLARGIESVTEADATITVRRCLDWSHLGPSIGTDDDPLVVVGIDQEYDRERAYQLSLDGPRARIIACELHTADLSVMRAGRVQRAGPATPAALAAVLGVKVARSPGAGGGTRTPTRGS
jgi:hypothetical protein